MADVLLTFGVDTSCKADLRNGIQNLIKEPFKVKIELDVQGANKLISQLRKDIKSAIESLDAVKKASVKTTGSTSSNNSTQVTIKQVNELINAATRAQTEMQKFQNATGDVGKSYYNTLSEATTKYNDLAESIKKGDVDAEQFRKTMDDVKDSVAKAKLELVASGEGEPLKVITQGTIEYQQSLIQVRNLLTSVKAEKDKLVSGKSVASKETMLGIDGIIGDLETLEKKLTNGMPYKEFQESIVGIRSKFAEFKTDITSTGTIFSRIFTNLGGGIKNYIASTFSAIRIVQTTIREIREMISTAIELDTAFTQLQIVTRASDTTMGDFSKTIASTAKDMSASVKDLVEVATVYSRLGYSLEESNVLAQYTGMLQNVGNIDTETASDAVTAIVKAYGLGVDQMESVMDKMVEVGNNFPISVSQIAEGMNNAASMMSDAGMSFEQSVALLTSANTTIQNISKSSTGLRTIIARLRNVKTELDEAGEVWNEAKYQELISALTKGGVNLQDATGALRNPYEILSELAAKWKTLSSDVQAAITTSLAGTRQRDIFSSLMNQFGEATGAMEAMADSAGSLEEAYSIFEESMQGHINVFKAAFEELSMEAVDSGFINSFIDLGTAIVEKLTPAIGVLGKFLGVLRPLGIAVSSAGIGVFAKQFSLSMNKVLKDAEKAGIELTKLQTIQQTFQNNKALIGIGAVTAVATIGIGIYNAVKQHNEKMRQTALESANNYEKNAASIETYKARIEELRTSLDSGNLSYQEAYDVRSELLTIQSEMAETLGEEAAAFDILSGSVENATNYLNGYMRVQADQTYMENADTFEKAISKMEGAIVGDVTNVIGSLEELEPLLSLLRETFGEENIQIIEDGLGGKELRVSGENARAYADSINEIYQTVMQMSGVPDGIKDDWKAWLLQLRGAADDVIDIYGSVYDSAIKLKVASTPDYLDLAVQAEDIKAEIARALESGDKNLILDALISSQNWQNAVNQIDSEGIRQYFYDMLSGPAADAFKEFQILKFKAEIDEGSIEDVKKALDFFREDSESQLKEFSEGGNVDLLARPLVDAAELVKEGWADAGEGIATVFTNTFSNEDRTIAMNFTPIIVDENGNVVGILSPDELQQYAEDVISGAREDDLSLKIGATFDGEQAIEDAVEVAEIIHELQADYYGLDGDNEKGIINLSTLRMAEQLAQSGTATFTPLTEETTAIHALNMALQDHGVTLEDVIPLLIEFGLVHDDITESIEQEKETSWFSAEISEGLDETVEKFGKLRDAMEKLEEGKLEVEEVIELVSIFPEIGEYVEWTSDSFGDLASGLRVANRNAPKALIETLEGMKDSGRFDESLIPQIDALIDRLYEMPEATFAADDAVDELALKYGTFADTVASAKKEIELLDAAINADTNKGYQTRMSAVQEMMELFAVGATGSESKIWDIAKNLGAPLEYIENYDLDKLFAWTERWSQFISENPYDSSGVENWATAISDIVSANKEAFDELGATWSFDGETLDFDVPNDKITEFLELLASCDETMSMTGETFYDMLTQLGQFYHLNWNGPKDAVENVKNAFSDLETAKKNLDDALASGDQAKIDIATEDLATAQETLNNIANLALSLQEITGIDLGITVTTDDDGNIIDVLLNGESLSVDAEVGVTTPEDTSVDVDANVDTSTIPTDIENGVSDMDPINVPAEVDGQQIHDDVQDALSGASTGAKPVELEVSTTEARRRVKDFQSLINAIKSKSVTIKANIVGSSGISSLYKQINTLRDKTITITTRYKSLGTGPQMANGSAHASGNWGIKRDEQALVGELGPEIVVRDGRWFTVGDYGAQFASLKKGDIVFNHKQAEALLSKGYVTGRGRALAEGSAYVSSSGSVKKSYTSSIYNYSNKYGTSSSSSSSSSSSKSSGAYTSSSRTTTTTTTTKNTDLQNWFEQQYAYHQHLVAMEQESQATFLNWLVTAYKKAYNEGIITLEDTYQYAEEVFNGLRDLYEDYLSDAEHEVSMREHFKGEEQAIIELYRKAIASVEEEIKTARKAGLDDNDAWIQTLQDRWWQYIEYLQDLEDDYTDSVKDSVGQLVNLRIDMLKQDIRDEKQAISERLKNLKDFYKQQKDMLKDAYDEEKYFKEQTEKRKAVADLQLQIEQLSLDNSAWAQKRRLELQEKLVEAQEELDEFEKDHALDVAQDALDALYDKQEAALNKQTDLLDEKLDYARGLYEQALEDIRNGSADLYEEMIEYNAYYGSGINSEITESWEAAYAALDDYYNLFKKHYEDINLENVTGYKTEGGWDTQLISDKGYAAYVAANPSSATTTTTTTTTSSSSSSGSTSTSSSTAKSYPYGRVSSVSGNISYGASGNSVKALQYALNQLGYGNSGTKSLDGVFGAGTRTAVYNFQRAMGLSVDGIVGPNTKAAFKKKGYASGTSYATAGIHRFGENGTEYMFTSANGNKYRLFSSGDKVLDAKSTNFLYQFATTGGRVLSEMIGSAIKDYASSGAINAKNIGSIRMGDIIIQGNADQRTVSEIRREQREGIDYILSKFTQFSR